MADVNEPQAPKIEFPCQYPIKVIGTALAESGLPAQEIFEAVQTPEVKQALIDTTNASVERGNFGSPCFFVDNEMFYGKETLWEVEEAINAKR